MVPKLFNCPPSNENRGDEQIALAGCDGNVYILNGKLELETLGSVDFTLEKLVKIPGNEGGLDLLVCSGHFDGFKVLKDGQVVDEMDEVGWVVDMVAEDIHKDGKHTLITLTDDNSISIFEIKT